MNKEMINILRKRDIFYVIDYARKIRFFHYRKNFPYLNIVYKNGVVAKINAHSLDYEIFERLVCSINSALGVVPTSQWKNIYDAYQIEIVRHLQEGNSEKVLNFLDNPLSNNIMYGFDNLAKSLQSRFRLETSTEPGLTADHFLALAEFAGVINVNNPESLVSPVKRNVSIDPIIDDVITKFFGQSIKFPNPYIGERGLSTSYGIASLRVPAAIYQAIQVTKLGKNICEIGPGLGRTAYFSKLLGAKKYTLVDIPISSLCQGYFLLRSLPTESYSFSREPSIKNGIQLRQPNEFISSCEEYDVILNVDSLTEIGIEPAREYLKSIIGRTKFFLSINHEANEFTVRNISQEFKEFKLVAISKAWLRPGYVEELYEVAD